MKQTKQVKKEKDNYLKASFLFPVVVSVIDVAVVAAALVITGSDPQAITNMALARLTAQAATIFISISPTMLLLTSWISLRHSKKYPKGSGFYIKTPMLLSVVVWGAQTLYMVSMM